MVEKKKATDEEVQNILGQLVVYDTGSLRIMGVLKTAKSGEKCIENAVRVDVDVLGRGPQGLVKSPNMGSIDYSKTPIPKYYVESGSYYFVRDLDGVSSKFTAAMYIEFCHDLNNWEEIEEEMKLAALRQQEQQRSMIARPGIPMGQLEKMVPITGGIPKR